MPVSRTRQLSPSSFDISTTSSYSEIYINSDTSEYLLNDFEQFVEDTIDVIPWNYHTHLSRNPLITMNFVERHLDKDWRWDTHGLSSNTSLDFDFVEHLNVPWDWKSLSANPALTMDFVNKHMYLPWDWGANGLSANPNLTIKFIKQHIDKPWQWNRIASNHKIRI